MHIYIYIYIYTRTHTYANTTSFTTLSHTHSYTHTHNTLLTHSYTLDTHANIRTHRHFSCHTHAYKHTPHFSCTPTLILSHFTPQSWTNKPGLAIGIITDACRAVDERVRVGILMAFNAQPLTTGPQITLNVIRVHGAAVQILW